MKTLLYNRVKVRGHPRADSSNNVLEHIVIVEKALGKHLDKRHEIHHVNECKTDNRNENLVVCEDKKYHYLLHLRALAIKLTRDPDKRKCVRCGEWNSTPNMKFHTKPGSRSGETYCHPRCAVIHSGRYK